MLDNSPRIDDALFAHLGVNVHKHLRHQLNARAKHRAIRDISCSIRE